MTLMANGLLLVAAFAAAFYCRVLAIRLRRLGDTDKGLGGAISTLTIQVDEMQSALTAVADSAEKRASEIQYLTSRADQAARRLELLLAALHDAQEQTPPPPKKAPPLQLTPHDKAAQPAAGTQRQISRLLTRHRKAKPQRVTG